MPQGEGEQRVPCRILRFRDIDVLWSAGILAFSRHRCPAVIPQVAKRKNPACYVPLGRHGFLGEELGAVVVRAPWVARLRDVPNLKS